MTTARAQDLLERATAVLAISDEDLIYKGIVAATTERIVALRRAEERLKEKYGSIERLEQRIKQEGVSPDDHTLYTDLLEWRAIRHELDELLHVLEAI